MAKMLMLDGPLAGKTWEVPRGAEHVQAVDHDSYDAGVYRLVSYAPHRIMVFAREVVVGYCGTYDARELHELMFTAIASDVAREIAAPLPRYVCDHAAAEIRCPHGCHGDGLRA